MKIWEKNIFLFIFLFLLVLATFQHYLSIDARFYFWLGHTKFSSLLRWRLYSRLLFIWQFLSEYYTATTWKPKKESYRIEIGDIIHADLFTFFTSVTQSISILWVKTSNWSEMIIPIWWNLNCGWFQWVMPLNE